MAPDQETDDSVYDFMYVDARRIAQFSSQFNQYGHLTGLTKTVNESRTGGGGINVGAAKLDKSTQAQEGQTKQFDPQWLNPLTFLDEANNRGMINRDPASAGIGHLILISGKLTILDISIAKSIWSTDQLIEKSLAGTWGKNLDDESNRHQRRTKRLESKPVLTDEARLAKAMLPSLPHLVQGSIYDDDWSYWFSLKDEFMITSPADLMLKNGIIVPGMWNAVGVLDARPNVGNATDASAHTLETLTASLKYAAMGEILREMSNGVRGMLGRPDVSYGLTPLLIFREVSR